jgi:hypothetical protein
MSPFANFGEEINTSSNLFSKLKAKGDTIHFRILGVPYYDGKHFSKDDNDKWVITPCPRINEKQECETCKKYFAAMADVKKMQANGEPKHVIEEAKKVANKYSASVSVYYPIINRKTETFQIFQTGMGVRNKIEAEVKLGTPVLKRDFIVLRTEQQGNYYALTKVDSADTKEYTEKELEEVKKFEATDLESLIIGVKGSEDSLSATKDADTSDINF